MSSVKKLEKKVADLYESKNPNRDDWADWLYKKHVFVVAEKAGIFSDRFGGNRNLAMAAGMLHDIADAVMRRDDSGHEEKSFSIAIEFLTDCGFTESEKEIILDDALKYHSCRNGNLPQTIEGKLMATADAVAHLSTDFYQHAIRDKGGLSEEVKKWGLEKIDRDFNKKIFFDEVREEARADYERLKTIFKN